MVTKRKTTGSSMITKQPGSMLPWLGIAAIVILLDQLSKITVSRLLAYGDSLPVTSFLNLVLAYNPGAAFSFLANESGWQRHVFTAIAIGAAIYIIYLIYKNTSQRLFCTALALILGGALGNVIDRIMYGHVIDFLDFFYLHSHFAAFNLADSAITLGATLFIVDELRRVKNK